MLHSKKFFVGTALLALIYCCWNCSPSKPDLGDAAGIKGSYGKDSTIFALAWLAGINTDMVGTTAALQKHASDSINAVLANTAVQSLIGTWTVVWGPVAFTEDTSKPDSCVTDNTMMLLQGKDPADPSKNLYVLSIAGTNAGSMFDWEDEDFAVQQMVKWPPVPQSGSFNTGYFVNPPLVSDSSVTNAGNYVSQGITTGINNLLNNMKDGAKGTVLQYLKYLFGTSYDKWELAVCGHSLGGGLSPVVALSLKDNQSYWNFSGTINITAYPFAGQSPGNPKFASYFASKIGAGNFHGAYNAIDMVPNAFNYNTMGEISTFYEDVSPDLQKECFLHGVINCVRKKASPFQYTSLYSSANAFTGQIAFSDLIYQAGLSAWDSLSTTAKNNFIAGKDLQGCLLDGAQKLYARTLCFAYMALENHTIAYVNYYGAQDFNTIFQQYMHKNGKAANILDAPLISKCLK